MQNLGHAKEFSAKADNYISEGNYEYAVRCYDHILKILVEATRQAHSAETLHDLQGKIKKYQAMKEAAQAKIAERQSKIVKVSKLGFPTQRLDPIDQLVKQQSMQHLKKNDYLHYKKEESRTEDRTRKEIPKPRRFPVMPTATTTTTSSKAS